MGAEALGIAERIVIDEADKPIEFHERVLQRRRRQQHLGCVRKRALERLADTIVGPVDVAEPVGFVDHDEIPRNDHEFVGIARGELKRADDKILLLEWAASAILLQFVIVASLQDCRR